MKAYTDIEQSKRLAEILPPESADMYWEYQVDRFVGEPEYLDNPQFGFVTHKKDIACWSLAALLNLLPSEFTEKGKYSETTYKIDIRKYALTDDVDIHQIAYGNYTFYEDGNSSWKDMINTGEKENLIDCCVQMIISLHEQKLL